MLNGELSKTRGTQKEIFILERLGIQGTMPCISEEQPNSTVKLHLHSLVNVSDPCAQRIVLQVDRFVLFVQAH
jgi:hypothetical protein